MVPTRVRPCLACTRSKVKCDKCSPCGRCVRLGLCCVETAPGRRSRQVTPDASPRRAFFACAAPDAPPPLLLEVADLPFGPFAGVCFLPFGRWRARWCARAAPSALAPVGRRWRLDVVTFGGDGYEKYEKYENNNVKCKNLKNFYKYLINIPKYQFSKITLFFMKMYKNEWK